MSSPPDRSAASRWSLLRDELHLLTHDPARRAMVEARADLCRLGVAMAMPGPLPRSALRGIADRANRRLFLYDRLYREPGLWEPFEIEGLQHLEAASSGGSGFIISPVHFGRYRWIPQALFDLGRRVTLLADQHSTEWLSAQMKIPDWTRHFQGVDRESIATVSSRSPTALWTLARALASGRVVVMFTDGNMGIHGKSVDRSSLLIPFLGCTIGARTGIAALAGHSGAPILPVIARDRPGQRPLLCFQPPIRIAEGEDKAAFKERATRALFGWLERSIIAAPARWEEWSTFTFWVVSSRSAGERGATVNAAAVPRSLPALVGKRLSLADSRIWISSARGAPQLFDVSTLTWLDGDPILVELVRAAEAGAPALDWVVRHGDTTHALRIVAAATARGMITLR